MLAGGEVHRGLRFRARSGGHCLDHSWDDDFNLCFGSGQWRRRRNCGASGGDRGSGRVRDINFLPLHRPSPWGLSRRRNSRRRSRATAPDSSSCSIRGRGKGRGTCKGRGSGGDWDRREGMGSGCGKGCDRTRRWVSISAVPSLNGQYLLVQKVRGLSLRRVVPGRYESE